MFTTTCLRRFTRQRVIDIFEELKDINQVLGEKFKVKSYATAVSALQDDEVRRLKASNGDINAAQLHSSAEIKNLSGFGPKLTAKVDEILIHGRLKELDELNKQPLIVAVRELAKVHGIGPISAKKMFDTHGVNSIASLRTAVSSGTIQLNEQQTIGLKYLDDISLRIPYDEVKKHEALLQKAVSKCLGPEFTLVVCGSYRRKLSTSGDVDALVSSHPSSAAARSLTTDDAAAAQLLPKLTEALQREKYLEAVLAAGGTKVMAIGRLSKKTLARRVDIRFVSPKSFPTALLYFTGSKEFNVRMRSVAAAKGFTLNEYGLFRVQASATDSVSPTQPKKTPVVKEKQIKKQKQPLADLSDPKANRDATDEKHRVQGITSEHDVFDSIGMTYVEPSQR